tara:strand:+ start:799 stop:1395 length:597 start_codon:yes stop_codon:yes gene_type:complete
MKKLLGIVVLVLIFSLQSWTRAEDITDIEIEGMSIGDSLLDYYSKSEIDEALKNPAFYKDEKYVEIFVNFKKKSEYDNLQITIQPDDNKFIIHSIGLIKKFPNKIEECKREIKKIINAHIQIVGNSERIDENRISRIDPSGNTFVYLSSFFPAYGGFFNISCHDYGQEVYETRGWVDSLTWSIGSDKFKKFLRGGDPY